MFKKKIHLKLELNKEQQNHIIELKKRIQNPQQINHIAIGKEGEQLATILEIYQKINKKIKMDINQLLLFIKPEDKKKAEEKITDAILIPLVKKNEKELYILKQNIKEIKKISQPIRAIWEVEKAIASLTTFAFTISFCFASIGLLLPLTGPAIIIFAPFISVILGVFCIGASVGIVHNPTIIKYKLDYHLKSLIPKLQNSLTNEMEVPHNNKKDGVNFFNENEEEVPLTRRRKDPKLLNITTAEQVTLKEGEQINIVIST